MLTGMEMMACQDLAVPAAVMRHIVDVESGANPYAIGVVGGRLQRQPKNLDEAVATARMLEAQGYNFSLGIAQVNRFNLGKYGLDTHEKAFDACSNLSAGSRILAGCYTRAGGEWGKAFSCYYSGNFVKGFQDGYVQKVYDSISRGRIVADNGRTAIPLLRDRDRAAAPPAPVSRKASEKARIAMRSGQPSNAQPRDAAAQVFVPQVRGPGEPLDAPVAAIDRADLRRGAHDSALVF